MTPTITINTGKKCTVCRKTGVVEENPSGLCMACIGKVFRRKLAAQRKEYAP